MTEKYIDLTEEIWRADEGRTSFGSVSMVLAYLDEHPDQVPGRTITESEAWDIAGRTFHRWGSVEELASHLRGTFRQLGITVVPEPEPTNAEKLEQLYSNWSQSNLNPPFGEWADSVGVKAPGGDDEH